MSMPTAKRRMGRDHFGERAVKSWEGLPNRIDHSALCRMAEIYKLGKGKCCWLLKPARFFGKGSAMDFTSLTRSDIDRLAKLITERDAIIARLSEISKVLGGGSSVDGRSTPEETKQSAQREKKAKKETGRSGAVKDAVIQVLKQAPVGGVSVSAIAETLKRKPAAIHVWFYTTGKTIKEIKKVGRSMYAWSE